jgi:hypothetical protein
VLEQLIKQAHCLYHSFCPPVGEPAAEQLAQKTVRRWSNYRRACFLLRSDYLPSWTRVGSGKGPQGGVGRIEPASRAVADPAGLKGYRIVEILESRITVAFEELDAPGPLIRNEAQWAIT